jgi:hypothetical protein
VEEYGIDECLADLSGMRMALGMNYIEIARRIMADADAELGFMFSVGLRSTKWWRRSPRNGRSPRGLRPFRREISISTLRTCRHRKYMESELRDGARCEVRHTHRARLCAQRRGLGRLAPY